MRLFFRRAVNEAHQSAAYSIPAAYFCAATFAYAHHQPLVSLFASTLAWLLLSVICLLRYGLGLNSPNGHRQRLCWAAGGLLALSQICDGAMVASDAVRWGKAFVPVILTLITSYHRPPSSFSSDAYDAPSRDVAPSLGAKRYLFVVVISSTVVLAYHDLTLSELALSLSSMCMLALALIIMEDAMAASASELSSRRGGTVAANGTIYPNDPWASEPSTTLGLCVRDLSFAVTLTASFATLVYDGFSTLSLLLRFHEVSKLAVFEGLIDIAWAFVWNASFVAVLSMRGSLQLSLFELEAALVAAVSHSFSFANVWFTLLASAGFASLTLDRLSTAPSIVKVLIRGRHILSVVTVLSVLVILFHYLSTPLLSTSGRHGMSSQPLNYGTTGERFKPVEFRDRTVHPVDQLIKDANVKYDAVLVGQSKTLEEAVTEYRRRYKISPPPNFDKWFEYAQGQGVQFIDEYDGINDMLVPFWALEPAVIRNRVREAIGNEENMLMVVSIRDGQAVNVAYGDEWIRNSTVTMMKDFLQYLPDMDLAFNLHDEPRIVVPHDTLAQMVHEALTKAIPQARANRSPVNSFSARPHDLGNGKRITEVFFSRFNVYPHQQTWISSRLSCSPDSPARDFTDQVNDNLTSWAVGQLGFIYNQTAFSDICMSPSLKDKFGFFERPNAYNVAHDLIPIFSPSKLSTYQDLLYPSPFYWAGRVHYDANLDMDWELKQDIFWWRGSTTGGYSRSGGWRRQHRQNLVGRLNSPGEEQVLERQRGRWRLKQVDRQDFLDQIDVHFSNVGQCDTGDCKAQEEYFDIADRTETHEAWKFKHLLDMDGNAFSGRFYAFLKSHSLPYKMAVFREWHQDWLLPWVHYVPLSLRATEWLETVRFFNDEPEGRAHAVMLANQGRDWARNVLRSEDFEVWFFRLLLEYGRLIDDNRSTIGFG